jgi:cytochrome c oxidase assembly protein subunit 11
VTGRTIDEQASTGSKKMDLRRKNMAVVAACIGAISVMTGIVAYSPTIYWLFCAATGYGGTTQRVQSGSSTISDRVVIVRFDTNVSPNLPWRFSPEQEEVSVRLGEQKLVFFSAENLSDQPIVGHATFNVAPPSAGIYFKKIQCFCFDEERLEAPQKIDMPVLFFVDPAFATDINTAQVASITLSYTFFRSLAPEKGKELSRLVAASDPNPAHGHQLFADHCASCHNLRVNSVGPMLGGVFDRRAGSSPGYVYSAALRQSDIVWSADNLERWLTGPGQFIKGTTMPVRISHASERRDIIAYLREESGQGNRQPEHASIAQPSSVRTNQ